MITKLLRAISGKEKLIHGDLFQDGHVVLEGCKLDRTKEKLFFKNKSDERYFLFDQIKSLELRSEALRFKSGEFSIEFASKDARGIEKVFYATQMLTTTVSYKNSAQYSVYDTKTALFVDERPVTAIIIEDCGKKFVRIDDDRKKPIVFQAITEDAQYRMHNENFAFVWSVLKNDIFHTFCLRFSDNLAFLDFVTKYVRTTSAENEDYFARMEIENYASTDTDAESSTDEYIDDEAKWLGEESVKKTDSDLKNSYLVVGPNKSAFVVRGDAIGLFRTEEDQLEFQATIKNVNDDESEMKKMITHNDGTSLIFLNENDRTKLKLLDLEKGEVVETWDLKRPVNDYFDSAKTSDNGTLIGVNDTSLFRIDPRTKEKITEEAKTYKTKNEFSCGMATRSGDVAVASRKGDLRLYDKIDKRAKTLLPGFGSEIKGIDMTSNGQYIICTCKSYLMLSIVNPDYKVAMGKEKPLPKRLQLKPEHLAFINEEIDFTPAKFSTDAFEELIVTSTGHYVVSWNLKDVLKGRLYSYTIKKYGDTVVADNFGFGENNTIIVMLPDDVKKVETERLRDMDREIKKKTAK